MIKDLMRKEDDYFLISSPREVACTQMSKDWQYEKHFLVKNSEILSLKAMETVDSS